MGSALVFPILQIRELKVNMAKLVSLDCKAVEHEFELNMSDSDPWNILFIISPCLSLTYDSGEASSNYRSITH